MATHIAQPAAAATAGEFNVEISIIVCLYCSLNTVLDIVLSVPLSSLLRISGTALTPAERVLPRHDACTQAATQMEQVEMHCESSSTVLSLLRVVPPAEGKLVQHIMTITCSGSVANYLMLAICRSTMSPIKAAKVMHFAFLLLCVCGSAATVVEGETDLVPGVYEGGLKVIS
jgi:hypothetical protein